MTGEHRSSWRRPFPSANLSTTNPTRICLGLKPELRGETPATSRLSHGWDPIRLYRSVRLPRSCESLQVFGSQFLSQSICRPYLYFFIVAPILVFFFYWIGNGFNYFTSMCFSAIGYVQEKRREASLCHS